MFDLPLRKSEVRVPVQNDEVTLILAPLTDAQTFQVLERGQQAGTVTAALVRSQGAARDAADDPEATVIAMPYSLMAVLLADRLRGVEGITIQGKPFDPDNAEHRDSLPYTWKVAAMTALVSYALEMPEGLRGNSRAPAAPSRGGSAEPAPTTTGAPAD